MTSGGFGLGSLKSGLSKIKSGVTRKSSGTGKGTGMFSKFKGAVSGLKGKATSKVQGSMMKKMGMDTSSLTGKFSSMFKSKKGLGALGAVGALGAAGTMGAKGAKGAKGVAPESHGIALPSIVFKIALLLFTTVLIGIFFSYIHNNEVAFGANVFDQVLVITSLVVAGLAISYIFKFGSIDFIISSEINILSFYMLASYIGLSSMASKGFFTTFLDMFKNAYDILTHPTQLFTKGFSVLVPLLLFIIPIFVLLFDATKSIFLPFVVLGISVGIVYILYPKNSVDPISGGIGSTTTKDTAAKACVSSNLSYFNPLNWGSSKC